MNKLFISFIFFVGFSILSCTKEATQQAQLATKMDAEIVLEWTSLINELIQDTEGYTIPASARAIAYIGIGVYEAALPAMPVHKSLQNQLPGFNHNANFDPNFSYDVRLSINKVYSLLCLHFFESTKPENLQKILALEKKWEQIVSAQNIDERIYIKSQLAGIAIANGIVDFEKQDEVGHQSYLKNFSPSFTLPSESGIWVPTGPHYLQATFPEWGSAKLLGVKNNTLGAILPPQYSNDAASPLYKAAEDLLIISNNLTPDQMHIAEFWDDYAPRKTMGSPGRWIAILAQVVRNENLSLEKTIEAFTQSALAIYNASILCWSEKYLYNMERPVTFIQSNIDTNFSEYMYSQSSPEYISEHSIIASAAAHIYESVIGSVGFTDRCHEHRLDFNGSPRNFRSFSHAAEECSISRYYAGTNYMFSIIEGQRLGKLAATQVMHNISWKY